MSCGGFTYISLFSGIEAATVAWDPLGWSPLAFCEVDDFPSAVLAHHYPNVPNLGDVCGVDWKDVVSEYGRPNVVVGGSPCQAFSVAGGRGSLMDPRGRLMFEYVRACDEIHSPWIVWENVPSVLNVRDNAFAQLLGALQDVGYVDLAWRVLDSQFVRMADRDDKGAITGWLGPVAQRRRRVFLVGHLGAGGAASAVLFESDSVRGNTKTSKQQRKELAAAVGRGDTVSVRKGELVDPKNVGAYAFKVRCGNNTYVKPDGKIGTAGKGALVCAEQTFTIVASQDQDILVRDFDGGVREAVTTSDGSRWIARKLMPVECERLFGFPDGYTDVPYRGKEHSPDSKRYKAVGNSMAVPCMRWIGDRIQFVQEIMDETDGTAIAVPNHLEG